MRDGDNNSNSKQEDLRRHNQIQIESGGKTPKDV
jgi:hypothetical protein